MSSDKTSWTVQEGEGTVLDKMNEDEVKIGDTIHYATSNQQGALTYEVVLKDGKKSLKLIDSYEMQMDNDYDDDYSGGKKRNKKTKSKKSKSKKTKSKKNRSKRTKKSNHVKICILEYIP